MPDRRTFIAGMLAAGLAPRPTWADAGSPAFLSAGKKPDGAYVLCGLTTEGQITFQLPLPTRGHAAAAHPRLAEAVAFARRPGTYAIVLDCITGREKARLSAPPGRHFYGHGTYSADGDVLFTTENDFDAARGVVGIWDARRDFARMGEFPSGGVGPHDIKLMPDGASLVVANGGIETHPETGRVKLNIPSMRSTLSYLSLDGELLGQVRLDKAHQKNSIRHLAVSATGDVAFAMQWQGDLAVDLPLLGVHRIETGRLDLVERASVRHMSGYLGSVAIAKDGKSIAATSPRAGIVQEFAGAEYVGETSIADVCGVAAAASGFVLTSGAGLVKPPSGPDVLHDVAWDNHLIAI
ncbi:putative exported protein [Candidatus Rhodobacter oscarellae]|uniref:Putative exported protein n=1 Tax=Candidatus Rhodobacter oscarellae TaxID=1675527 RepID=A0A0J9EAX5_9RHOB|nr:DUF1513 domain-containing protein [Candidatus Rhodobacter lobularis]KMW59776.1 putative exported protein [Candidatus Rhodobacter lobularis]